MSIRDDFPILEREFEGRPLVYLDNAATLQVPLPVLASVEELYRTENGNVRRSPHVLGRLTGRAVEDARETVRAFLGAEESEEIIFTSGTTDGINMLAEIFEEQILRPGDRVITTELEHHSNLLPWVRACRRSGAELEMIPMDENGDLDPDAFRALLNDRTKLVTFGWVSNAIGTVSPAEEITKEAHAAGVPVLIDAAQAVLHLPVDVKAADFDFLVFSGHKAGSLTGTGVLYMRSDWLQRLKPVRLGGGMVTSVEGFRYEPAEAPYNFEAGTPNTAGIISLGAALSYLEEQGREKLARDAQSLLLLTEKVLEDAGVQILGHPKRRAGAVSFVAPGVHSYDVAQLLDRQGICVRSGHHCAANALRHFGTEHSVRVSPAFYNTEEEINLLAGALRTALDLLGD
ncbi:MAG: cysteine desulfurase, partial [Oscillospiraceae bacterium]|nr:cysteine desulfurase [Oscillospiraceae bacterium]